MRCRKQSYSALACGRNFRRGILLPILAMPCCTLSAGEAAPGMHSAKEALLIVINGESNSGGYALNTEATPEELAPRPEVQILNNDTLVFENLDIGTNNLLGHFGLPPADTHGFELEIANLAVRLPEDSRPIYLVKTGQGGSKIAEWADNGKYYDTFRKRVTAAKTFLKDRKFRTVILFSLGINDAIAVPQPDKNWSKAVKEHFKNMRKELGADTPIVMTQFMPRYAAYNKEIEKICRGTPNTYPVDTHDASLRDDNHWDCAGMKLVAGRMLDAVEKLGLMPASGKSPVKPVKTQKK